MNRKIKIIISVIVAILAVVLLFSLTFSTYPDAVYSPRYATVDTEVLFGDYSSMLNLSKDIQNGYAIGKIVKIDGTVSHPGAKYSITESTEDGSKTVGTEFEIEGNNVTYPDDGVRVTITGEVVEKSTLYYIIKTSPEFVEIQD